MNIWDMKGVAIKEEARKRGDLIIITNPPDPWAKHRCMPIQHPDAKDKLDSLKGIRMGPMFLEELDDNEITQRYADWGKKETMSEDFMEKREKSPTICIDGIRIANFSSAHAFEFDNGQILPACSAEHAEHMKLDVTEREFQNDGGWVDVELYFELTAVVYEHLKILANDVNLDIILVPLPVQQAFKDMMNLNAFSRLAVTGGVINERIMRKMRVIRKVDRVSNRIHSKRFCI